MRTFKQYRKYQIIGPKDNLNLLRLQYDFSKKPWNEDAKDLRDWYIKSFMDAGFILWQDPIIGCLDDYIAYLGN